ncbi:uncharacterized protein BO72DRAFT_223794 [Aspergillus fijiensis CBS 313.89]|uniref:Uncharacterized protein n=1 Tax=Aspergillus fijiensis CBS 313.89 TaxID=1448319 RepID=A0A8G1RI40_9EURO|nr:uncharacterized protein BO72DRAFT_223794 [Aspergillus fijiensis CBS 313.89]RAK73760.1 hypothetical protein BO72DRAFT_223794 [Aspergillus fijiensis CBS 313.89]
MKIAIGEVPASLRPTMSEEKLLAAGYTLLPYTLGKASVKGLQSTFTHGIQRYFSDCRIKASVLGAEYVRLPHNIMHVAYQGLEGRTAEWNQVMESAHRQITSSASMDARYSSNPKDRQRSGLQTAYRYPRCRPDVNGLLFRPREANHKMRARRGGCRLLSRSLQGVCYTSFVKPTPASVVLESLPWHRGGNRMFRNGTSLVLSWGNPPVSWSSFIRHSVTIPTREAEYGACREVE